MWRWTLSRDAVDGGCQLCGGGYRLGMRQMVVVNHVEVDTVWG